MQTAALRLQLCMFVASAEVVFPVAGHGAVPPAAVNVRVVMQKSIFEFIVDGFASGETDFLVHLDSDPFIKAAFIAEIIVPIVGVLNSVNDGATLSVSGHSDRVDTAGLGHFDCLAQEKSASEDRVISATAGIHTLVQQIQPSAPSDLNTLPFFFVSQRAPGAGVLVNGGGSLSEAQRKQNRRVQARLVVFTP
jgi:hypothetical protein